MVISREVIDISITQRSFKVVLQVIRQSQSRNTLGKIGKEIFLGSQLQVNPHTPLIRKSCLIEIAQPYLLNTRGLLVLGVNQYRDNKSKNVNDEPANLHNH